MLRPGAASGVGLPKWAAERLGGCIEMTREADVVRSLVEMADNLVDDYDVVDLLTGLANGA